MNVASLVSSEWSDLPRNNSNTSSSSYSSQPSPAASLSGSVRKFDEYQEKPSPITTSATSYFSAVNSSNNDNRRISTQLPLSPPADDQRKCSLPSISTLLEGVDCMPASKRQRHNSNEYSRIFLPPTPPMRPSSGFTERGSPSARSHSASISSAVSHPQTSLPPISASLATPAPSSSSERASSLSISSLASHDIPSPSPTTTSTITTTTITTPSTSTSTSYYTSSSSSTDEQSYSRTTQPSAPATPVTAQPPAAMVSPVNPGWQHHHYFPISTAAASYPQNHERYVCRTCHKAFSRPSSLRIHSHSHTGEKPFRCTHAGCGKAFSVRSNMKRHERGCHSGRPLAATALV